jgi:hypothetical protein
VEGGLLKDIKWERKVETAQMKYNYGHRYAFSGFSNKGLTERRRFGSSAMSYVAYIGYLTTPYLLQSLFGIG